MLSFAHLQLSAEQKLKGGVPVPGGLQYSIKRQHNRIFYSHLMHLCQTSAKLTTRSSQKFAGPLAQRSVRSLILRASFRSTKCFVRGTAQRTIAALEPPWSLPGAYWVPPRPFHPRLGRQNTRESVHYFFFCFLFLFLLGLIFHKACS